MKLLNFAMVISDCWAKVCKRWGFAAVWFNWGGWGWKNYVWKKNMEFEGCKIHRYYIYNICIVSYIIHII